MAKISNEILGFIFTFSYLCLLVCLWILYGSNFVFLCVIFGGVPYYWGFLKKGYSLAQNIDRILFEAFTLFYFKFLKNPPTDEHFWSNQMNTPAVNTWMGLAFERVCMGHIVQIKKKLGISGVLTEVSGIKFTICRCRPGQNMQFIQQWLPHMDS